MKLGHRTPTLPFACSFACAFAHLYVRLPPTLPSILFACYSPKKRTYDCTTCNHSLTICNFHCNSYAITESIAAVTGNKKNRSDRIQRLSSLLLIILPLAATILLIWDHLWAANEHQNSDKHLLRNVTIWEKVALGWSHTLIFRIPPIVGFVVIYIIYCTPHGARKAERNGQGSFFFFPFCTIPFAMC